MPVSLSMLSMLSMLSVLAMLAMCRIPMVLGVSMGSMLDTVLSSVSGFFLSVFPLFPLFFLVLFFLVLILRRIDDPHNHSITGVLHILNIQLFLHSLHGDVGLCCEGQHGQTKKNAEHQPRHGS